MAAECGNNNNQRERLLFVPFFPPPTPPLHYLLYCRPRLLPGRTQDEDSCIHSPVWTANANHPLSRITRAPDVLIFGLL